MIRRRGQEVQEESSSEEEDAFTALSRKNGRGAKRKKGNDGASVVAAPSSVSVKPSIALPEAKALESSAATATAKSVEPQSAGLPMAVTSSMKRHHKPNDTRKAKMDALILELEIEKGKQKNRDPNHFVPEKKGSFVEPGEEKLTSNLFVGNLAPSITEEDVSNLFSQFGPLYSIKIMWPRTPEERNRARNTGFVCFVNREDAEDAIESCNDTDPFNVGRLLTLRWGKNVKKTIRRGVGGLKESSMPAQDNEQETGSPQNQVMVVPEIVEKELQHLAGTFRSDGVPNVITLGGTTVQDLAVAKAYDPKIHAAAAIRVVIPKDPARFHFISTVASYVAKDGMSMEKRLWEEEQGNPLFNFLTLENADEQQRIENIFYRWRVYSFSQGDTFAIWRTEPFVMFHPNGRYWIPPPLDKEAVALEKAKLSKEEDSRLHEKVDRTRSAEMFTGRQLERARRLRRRGRGTNRENPSVLSPDERAEFDRLVRKELSVSREKICQAMAFCFDKCLAAKDVSILLEQSLKEDSFSVTVDMRVARLYLLSDILFNSQQPGVRNAFMYRSTIEAMAPDVFKSLGKYRESNVGRMTVNKLRKAVSSVLGAWTAWGVYNSTFMDELEAHFEGKEITVETNESSAGLQETEHDSLGKKSRVPTEQQNVETTEGRVASVDPSVAAASRGQWTEVVDLPEKDKKAEENPPIQSEDVDGKPLEETTDNLDGEDIDGDEIDGEEIDGEECADIDGQAVNETDVDGESIDGDAVNQDEVDGESIDGDCIDGEELNADNDVN